MDGAIIAVLWVEAEKPEPRLPGPGAGVKEDRRHVELALELRLDRADPQIGVERLKVCHQHDRRGLALKGREPLLQPGL